ncbi:MAG TPA: tetratricopeptide repeat protein, partial [Spirochaetota bacterium]|nr:tetratricopeptide repeat protein [Spirochaetota bacterium]
MNGIRKNRLTLSADREYEYNPQSNFPQQGNNPKKKYQVIAAALLLLIITGGAIFLITKYKKGNESILSKIEFGAKDKDEAYTRSDKMDTPGTDSENVHLRRGIDSYSKGYFNDAANEFSEVINSDASSKDKAQALTYLGIIEDERGNFTKAIDYYKRALKYDSDSKLSASTY